MPFRPVFPLPCLLLAGLLATALPLTAAPLSTAITYQGRLTDAGLPANDLYDVQVCLFDALVAGDELDCVDSDDVPVEDGLFTLELDFGPVFRGDEAWLELRVRPGESSGGYTTLAPRQAVRAVPEALHAQLADVAGEALTVALCRNPACGSASLQTLDDTFDKYFPTGSQTSLAIGADSLPVISYYDPTPGRRGLKLARCSNAACTSRTRNTVDTNGDVGGDNSMLIGADGLPLIAYLDIVSRDIRIARCGNAACSTVTSIITLDEVRRGGPVSMAMGVDGRPVIAYHTVDNRELKVAHCGNVACSANNTITVVDPLPSSSGGQTSIAIGSDGLPIMTYYDNVSGNLKVAHCGNAACTADNSIGRLAGVGAAIAIGADGLPVIAYAQGLKVARCGTRFCQ